MIAQNLENNSYAKSPLVGMSELYGICTKFVSF